MNIMDRVLLSNRLWWLSYVLLAITLLWTIWIFGFVWYYYDGKISVYQGVILMVLSSITIVVRETALGLLKKGGNRQ